MLVVIVVVVVVVMKVVVVVVLEGSAGVKSEGEMAGRVIQALILLFTRLNSPLGVLQGETPLVGGERPVISTFL